MAKYVSGRQKNLKVGISSYSENLTSLEIVGNVGINTTNATAPLDVLGGAIFRGSSPNELVRITQIGTGPAFIVEDSENPDVTPFLVTTEGKVAIGVAAGGISTSYKLEVNGGDIRFVSGSKGDLIISHQDLVSNIRAAGNIQLGLGANGGDAIRINLNNNIGFGTTNPTSKLYVVGDGYFTGVVTASTFSGNAATATYATSAGISTYSGTAGIATYATSAGIATNATYSGTSGIATYAGTAGIATNATYATSAGIATYATSSGIATYATSAGIATYAGTAGIATYATSAGIATYATKLQTLRTFELTGDVIASPISFDGSGNVSLAATIQPNSVGLGTDTFGDYVKNITGTTGQIVVTGGTGEGSTPVLSFSPNPTLGGNVTIGNDLQVNRNLNVTGNITVGGTTAYIIVQDFRVTDADITLGFTTDVYGNDASTDTTANHGGIAIASTQGSPLVQLVNVSIGESLPATYKKFMWFKSGSFAGLNTDAWLSNYAIGIGSTQFPTGTRLAVGAVQFNERDLSIVRNINSTGIITGTLANSLILNTSGVGLSGIATYNNSGSTTFTVTSNATSSNTSSTIVSRDASGNFSAGTITANLTGTASTASFATTAYNLTDAANITTGIINSARLSGSYNISISGNAATATYATSAGISTYATSAGIATYATSAGIATYATSAGIVTYATSAGIATYATSAGIATYATSAGIATYATSAGIATYATSAGIATNATYSGTAGIATYAVTAGIATYATSAGIATYATYAGTAGIATYATSAGIATNATYSGTAGIATYAVTAGIATYATSAGIATHLKGGSGGTIVYQSATDTTAFLSNGTSGQILQSNGGTAAPSWVNAAPAGAITGLTIRDEGNIVGSSNSVSQINFVGNIVTATASAGIATITFLDYVSNSGVATYAGTSGIATYATSAGIATNVIGGIASVTQLNVTGITTLGVTSATNFTSQQINISGISTIGNLQITPVGTGATVGSVGVLTYYGDGSKLSGISAGVGVNDDTTTNSTYYVGISTITTGTLSSLVVSSTKLTFNPSTGNLVAGGTVTANSDRKLKTNIKTIDNALHKVLSLRGVEFDRIDTGDHQIGVIAQEVEQIIPDVVYGEETKSVAYANLVGLLIEAIKEQNKEIQELKIRLGER